MSISTQYVKPTPRNTMAGRPKTVNNMVDALANTDQFCFCFTGSRFFGTHDSTSDRDYFTGDSVEVRKFLVDLGFSPEKKPRYGESPHQDTADVFVWVAEDGQVIHVQLVGNPERKSFIQNTLMNEGWGPVLKAAKQNGGLDRQIWDLFYMIGWGEDIREIPVRRSRRAKFVQDHDPLVEA